MADDDDFLSELDRKISHAIRHGTWPAYIVRALWRRPEGMQKQAVLNAIRADCTRRARTMPNTFSDTVQASFEKHNSGSEVFSRRQTTSDADLFYFAGKKGDGEWGLHTDRAKSWMLAKGFELAN
jgi:hypothetical protein